MKNIFENMPSELKEEFFEKLIETDDFVVERIISEGHSSPENFWYDQETNEFVLLLKGNAKITFKDRETIDLKPGNYFVIPAHKKHRVEETDKNEKTFWLTIHYK